MEVTLSRGGVVICGESVFVFVYFFLFFLFFLWEDCFIFVVVIVLFVEVVWGNVSFLLLHLFWLERSWFYFSFEGGSFFSFSRVVFFCSLRGKSGYSSFVFFFVFCLIYFVNLEICFRCLVVCFLGAKLFLLFFLFSSGEMLLFFFLYVW